MLVYGAKTPLGSRTMVWRLNPLSSPSLMRAQTPSPKSVPFGTTTAARAGPKPFLGARRRRRILELVLEDVTCHRHYAIVRTVIPPLDKEPSGQLDASPQGGLRGMVR